MSNVLYTCGDEACTSRLFAAPGGTNLKCRHHPEAGYVQREDGAGNLFLYTDEPHKGAGKGKPSGRAGSKAAIGTPEVKAEVPIQPVVTAPGNLDVKDGSLVTVVDPDNLPEDLRGLRRVYEIVFGERPDLRFREAKLNAKIQAELERQAEDEEADKEFTAESSDADTVDENGEEE